MFELLCQADGNQLLLSIGKLAHLAQVYDNAVSMNEKTLDCK